MEKISKEAQKVLDQSAKSGWMRTGTRAAQSELECAGLVYDGAVTGKGYGQVSK